MMTPDLWCFFIGCILFVGGYWIYFFGGLYGIHVLALGVVMLLIGTITVKFDFQTVFRWVWIGSSILGWSFIATGVWLCFHAAPKSVEIYAGMVFLLAGSITTTLIHVLALHFIKKEQHLHLSAISMGVLIVAILLYLKLN